MTLNILHLYPKEMNLYGDHGNVLALQQRCVWRNIKTKVIPYEPGDELPEQIDIIFGGGGQDSGQDKIATDLQKIAPKLRQLIENGTPALVICGIYQLFGQYFQTHDGHKLPGANIFDCYTIGSDKRLIGNITINTPEFGEVVGYENHSGLTYLSKSATSFGTVMNGAGNNGLDLSEGVKLHNCIGTYLHGPILPKNPRLADFLIQKALEKHGKNTALTQLDDQLEHQAHQVAASRPR